MEKYPLLRKGLTLAIVVLFVGIGIIPMASSLSTEKYAPTPGLGKELPTSMKTESRGINITLHGTMGWNGWYVSAVLITFTADNISVASIQYRLDNGSWQTYTAPVPIRVHEDGYHSFELRIIDTNGNAWYAGPVYFKIDQTPPFILITKERIGLFRWRITVNPSDNTSGLPYIVGFYINGQLEFTCTSPPYVWTLEVWTFWKPPSLTVGVYDNAGNFGDVPITNSLSLIQSNNQPSNQQNIQSNPFPQNQQSNQLLHNLIYNLMLRYQMMS